MINYVCDDGGRAEAGYKGSAGDCGCRAISIATGFSYKYAYALINLFGAIERESKARKGRSASRTGVHGITMKKVMQHLGWTWIGCRVHLTQEELPGGKIIVSLSKHYAAVIDGVLHDTYDCSREGRRCVYGIWKLI